MAKKMKGFTLIELLIVVAIIAILAAIAVPNFLEAQTRSKVTKTVADMRTIVFAVTSYIVDHNDVINIYDRTPTHPITFWLREEGGPESMGNRLSTPIQYISEVPWDHFNTILQSSIHDFTKRVAVSMNAKPLNEEKFSLYKRFHWNMQSFGPDLLYWNDAPGAGLLNKLFYDPTNGTISAGDIWYFSGWGFGHPNGDGTIY
jgi:prepilin-type N-terminal cleavage/methylation domain-containing protein